MKPMILLVTAGLLTSLASLPVIAQSSVLAASPDHPKTWVAGANKSYLVLRWDHQKQLLVADVTYSTKDWADDTHPPEEEDFTLSFPAVRFNSNDGTFSVGGRTVGRLHHRFIIGDDIVLEKGEELSVHRRDGVIFGFIVTARNT